MSNEDNAKPEGVANGSVNSCVIREHRGQPKPMSIRIDTYACSEMEQSTQSHEFVPSNSRETTLMVAESDNDETSAILDHMDDKQVVFSGNSFVDITKGDMYKKNERVEVPNCHEILNLIAPWHPVLQHIRIIRNKTPNQIMVLPEFRCVESAMEFYGTYNGTAFNNLEPESLCHTVWVSNVEWDYDGHTELPSCTQLETNLSRLPIEKEGNEINKLKHEIGDLMFNLDAQNTISHSDSKNEIAKSSPRSVLRLRGGGHHPNFSESPVELRWIMFNDAQERAFRIREELGDAQYRHIGRDLFETLSIEVQAVWTLQNLGYIITVKDVGGEQKRWLGMTLAEHCEGFSAFCAMAFAPLAFHMETSRLFSWLMALLILISFSVHTAIQYSPRFKSYVRKFGSLTGFWWNMITIVACIFLRFGTEKLW